MLNYSSELRKLSEGSGSKSPHSSIDYLPSREFRRKFQNDPAFRDRFEKKEVEVKLDEN